MTEAESLELLADQGLGLDYLRRILLAPVYDVAVESDLTPCRKLSARYGHNIYLKREDQQPVHSFKLRGAYNKLASLTAEEKALGVVAASAGNHAQGMALAANKLGIEATIFMPITTPDIKVDNVRRFGADVRLVGKSFNEAQTASVEFATSTNKLLIHPFDDEAVIAGQGTVAVELLQQLPKAEKVFIPVGGGGLLAGMAVYIKQLRPDIKVIGVEAEDSACLKAAMESGKPVDLDAVGLFADGVAVKRIGQNTFNLIKRFCDEVITVSTDEICTAIKDIFEQTRVIAEPAGALSLAGISKYCQAKQSQATQEQTTPSEENLVAILSGANMNFHTLRYVSERCELGENKEAVLSVTIPEVKGSFKRFCHIIGGRAITEFNYRYDGNEKANVFVGVRLGNDEHERSALIQSLTSSGYNTIDLTDDELAKVHVRYMIGGKVPSVNTERIFSFEFPEYPGALDKFLENLGELWNISLFHYRNHGAAFGQVLAGFAIKDEQANEFFMHLDALGYQWQEETNNPAYQAFLG